MRMMPKGDYDDEDEDDDEDGVCRLGCCLRMRRQMRMTMRTRMMRMMPQGEVENDDEDYDDEDDARG